jgi:DNA modification methylase
MPRMRARGVTRTVYHRHTPPRKWVAHFAQAEPCTKHRSGAAKMSNKNRRESVPSHIASEIRWRRVDALRPFPGNARKHPEKQLAMLNRSIERFGVTNPILVDESLTILAGHARLEIARRRNLATVPTLMVTGLSESEKRALVVADNRVPEQAVWDMTLLKDHFEVLIGEGFDVELTGFSTGEVDLILDGAAPAAEQDPDDNLPEVDENGISVSQLGDVWDLGPHQLKCGDACKSESYAALIGDNRAEMVFADPLYNVRIAGHAVGRGRRNHREFVQASGEMSAAAFTRFLADAMHGASNILLDGGIEFWCMDWRHLGELQAAAATCGLEQKNLIAWVKNNAGQGSFYRSQHELIAVYKKGRAPHINNFRLGGEGRYRSNVWTYPSVNSLHPARRGDLELHPTVKPVALVADAIRDCSKRNGFILDPFAGSGTTALAAERAGRIARLIELDPLYVDVAIRRWQGRTGYDACLRATGETFSAIAETRLVQNSQGEDGAARRRDLSVRARGRGR